MPGTEVNEKKMPVGNNMPKIIVGVAIVLLLVGYLTYRVLDYIADHSSTQYEECLAKYYKAIVKNNTNGVIQYQAEGFVNELAQVKVSDGRYDLFSYEFKNLEPTNKTDPVTHLVYGLNINNINQKMAYVALAYFELVNDTVKIKNIKKIYEGKCITVK